MARRSSISTLLLPQIFELMREGDLLIITADHGNDPTWKGTDHTRERIPVLTYAKDMKPGSFGGRETFADIGQTIASTWPFRRSAQEQAGTLTFSTPPAARRAHRSAPANVLSSLNSATGAVSARCMASITVLSDVPGVAQNTGWTFLHQVFELRRRNPGGLLRCFIPPLQLVVLIQLEARGLAPVEPYPATARLFEFAFAAHHVPCGEHAKADSHWR